MPTNISTTGKSKDAGAATWWSPNDPKISRDFHKVRITNHPTSINLPQFNLNQTLQFPFLQQKFGTTQSGNHQPLLVKRLFFFSSAVLEGGFPARETALLVRFWVFFFFFFFFFSFFFFAENYTKNKVNILC